MSKQPAIIVDNVSMKFNLSKEKVDSLKDYIIKSIKKEIKYNEFWALQNVSFTVEKGDRVGILGLNGAGKSTLLKVIAGVFKPTEGSVTKHGKMVPLLELGAGFDPQYTGKENIYLYGAMLGYSKEFIDEKYDDILFDFLVSACGWERNINSSQFQKESPYSKTLEIIKLAAENREAANIRLKKYVEKEWLEGHASYGWKTAHKKVGYVGLWSFESAALAKILALNDEKLKSSSHYPYDLAHYKSNKRFSVKAIETVEKNRRKDETGEGIVSNRELECIVPAQFQNMVNTAIMDYDKLEDEEFWNKYKLSEIWYTLEMYEDDKKKAILLGTILVNLLVDKGYIIQIDYKEDIEDYIDNIKNFWGEQEIKLVRFELENDQNYYAKVPRISNVKNMYEVHILDER